MPILCSKTPKTQNRFPEATSEHKEKKQTIEAQPISFNRLSTGKREFSRGVWRINLIWVQPESAVVKAKTSKNTENENRKRTVREEDDAL